MGARTRHNVSAEQAVAYRVAAHHLHDRLPAGSLVDAAATSGIQDTPPGSAAVALAARVDRLRPSDVEEALLDDRSLIRLLGLRGAAHVVPRRDGTVFGPGALAADEESLREQLQGSWPALEARDWTALEALGVVVGVLAAVVADGEPRTKGQLSEALHGRVPPELEPWCDVCDVHHVPDQLLRLAGTAGVFCYGWPQAGRQMLTGTDIWLGGPLGGEVAAARHELVRRFVHAFGPAGPRQFAAWTGMGAVEARDRFERLRPELVEVKLDGVVGWMLSDDLAAIDDPPMAVGARLLPTGDPFLAQRDRSTLLPDRAAQRAVWRPSGSPGLVLLTGRPMATWRARVAAGRLDVAVEPFTKLSDRQRWAVEQEAAVIAPFRGRELASVTFTD
ncbi:MAG TPA: winged helix DNA-binding domain-containing protein [Acidimicrobiales bacterium]|nr:winged helix DNA-binding domain-containing protein [Acidimicrobiales bacterium]